MLILDFNSIQVCSKGLREFQASMYFGGVPGGFEWYSVSVPVSLGGMQGYSREFKVTV